MAEKSIQETNSEQMKERFHFMLTMNGNIVCKRYFRINGFKNDSKFSQQLVSHYYEKNEDGTFGLVQGVMERCVDMILDQLKHKTEVYLWETAPQMFASADEMNTWVERHLAIVKEHENDEDPVKFPLKTPTYLLLNDTKDVYVWTGEKVEPYNIGGKAVGQYTNIFNTSDYIEGGETNVIKFAFYDNGREVCSKVWDANIYPRFVRNNIDLSNKNNKYKTEGQYQIVEATLIDLMSAGLPDLIPMIIREFCQCCSIEDSADYATTLNGYELHLGKENSKRVRNVERVVRKKTDKYVRTIEKFYNDKAYQNL